MKRVVCLLFFVSLFLFILPNAIMASHKPECISACGTLGCNKNEEFCEDFDQNEWCETTPACAPTPTLSCACGAWISNACGVGVCAPNQRFQFRICNPSLCEKQQECVPDSTCIAPTPTPTKSPPVSTPTPGGCSGPLKLLLNPNPANKIGPITATAFNLKNCSGNTVKFIVGSCDGLIFQTCTPTNGIECKAEFTPTNTQQLNVYACINMNPTANKDFNDPGESASVLLTFGGASTPTSTPTPTKIPAPTPFKRVIVDQGNDICIGDGVFVNPANNFNATYAFNKVENRTQTHRINLQGKSITGIIDSNGIITFELGRLPPGDYTFLYSIDTISIPCGAKVGGKWVVRIPDVGQGGSTTTTSGNLEITPLSPTNTDVMNFLVKSLPKDSVYAFHFTTSKPDDGSTKCQSSQNKQAELSTGPFKEGTWSVNISEKDPRFECTISSNVVATGKFTISAPLIAPAILPTPATTKIPPLSPCAEWGEWDNTKKEYIPINPDHFKAFDENKDGQLNANEIIDRRLSCIKLNTAIGEIDPNPKTLVARIFSLVLGLGGGIALILIIISGYRFMTSGGNPESFQAAKDMLVSAIVGLLFIIFSFVILQVIGVDILHIPGFG